MSKKDVKKENKKHAEIEAEDDDITLEEMSFMLQDMLRATLFFAGVKKDDIEDGVDAYMNCIDEVFGEEEGMMGFEEVVRVVEFMKSKNPNLFTK